MCQVVRAEFIVPEYEMIGGRWKAKWDASQKEKYKWVLNATDLESGITNFGAHTRLRVALDRMIKGELTFACVNVGRHILEIGACVRVIGQILHGMHECCAWILCIKLWA